MLINVVVGGGGLGARPRRSFDNASSQREAAGISLRQMAERMAMDVGALSRLENGVNGNPTLETLFRYANSLGKKVLVQLVDLPKSSPRKKKPAH